jgi:hypothetical protein
MQTSRELLVGEGSEKFGVMLYDKTLRERMLRQKTLRGDQDRI